MSNRLWHSFVVGLHWKLLIELLAPLHWHVRQSAVKRSVGSRHVVVLATYSSFAQVHQLSTPPSVSKVT